MKTSKMAALLLLLWQLLLNYYYFNQRIVTKKCVKHKKSDAMAILLKLIFKNPRFVPFETNLTQFRCTGQLLDLVLTDLFV